MPPKRPSSARPVPRRPQSAATSKTARQTSVKSSAVTTVVRTRKVSVAVPPRRKSSASPARSGSAARKRSSAASSAANSPNKLGAPAAPSPPPLRDPTTGMEQYYLKGEYDELREKLRKMQTAQKQREMTPQRDEDDAALLRSRKRRFTEADEARSALIQDFGFSAEGAMIGDVESLTSSKEHVEKNGTGLEDDFMDYFDERYCLNHLDPRVPRCRMYLASAEELVDMDAVQSTAQTSMERSRHGTVLENGSFGGNSNTDHNASSLGVTMASTRVHPGGAGGVKTTQVSLQQQGITPIELRKPANVDIIENVCARKELGRLIYRAFYTAFGDDYGDKLTLLQFKTFIKDIRVCERGVSMAAMNIMFTSLTRPLTVMCLAGFTLAMMFISSMMKKTVDEDEYDALEAFSSSVLKTYVAEHLPAWADPETDYRQTNAQVKKLILAYERPLEELFALSETNPAAKKHSGGSGHQPSRGLGGPKKPMPPPQSTHHRPSTTSLHPPTTTRKASVAFDRLNVGGAQSTAENAQQLAQKLQESRRPRTMSDTELARFKSLFPTFVTADDEKHFVRGCQFRTLMKLHVLIRFVNSLDLLNVTNTDIIRAARAAVFIYPDHPFRKHRSAAVTDCEGMFLFAPEFINVLVRLSLVAYPIADKRTTSRQASVKKSPGQSIRGTPPPQSRRETAGPAELASPQVSPGVELKAGSQLNKSVESLGEPVSSEDKTGPTTPVANADEKAKKKKATKKRIRKKRTQVVTLSETALTMESKGQEISVSRFENSMSLSPPPVIPHRSTVSFMKHPGESLEALLRFHIHDAYFSSFREPIKSKMNPFINVDDHPTDDGPSSTKKQEGSPYHLHHASLAEDYSIAKLPPPPIAGLQLHAVTSVSAFAVDKNIARNDADVGRVCCMKQEGGVLRLLCKGLEDSPIVYVLFNNRVSVRCFAVDANKNYATVVAPPLQLVRHRLTNHALDSDYRAFAEGEFTITAASGGMSSTFNNEQTRNSFDLANQDMSIVLENDVPEDDGDDEVAASNAALQAQFSGSSDRATSRHIPNNKKPERLVYCVRDGTTRMRVLSILRFAVTVRFSTDAIHWTPRVELPSFEANGAGRFHEKLAKLLPKTSDSTPRSGVVLYEQQLPVTAVPKELMDMLLFIFHKYVRYRDELNEGFMVLPKWRQFATDFFNLRMTTETPPSSKVPEKELFPQSRDGTPPPPSLPHWGDSPKKERKQPTPPPQPPGEAPHVAPLDPDVLLGGNEQPPDANRPARKKPLTVTIQNLRRAFSAHCSTIDVSRSKSVVALNEQQFFGALLEIVVNEHDGVNKKSTADLMLTSRWWDVLADVINTQIKAKLEDAVSDGAASPTRFARMVAQSGVDLSDAFSPLKKRPKNKLIVPPRDQWDSLFEPDEKTASRIKTLETTALTSGKHSMQLAVQSGPRIYDVYHGPAIVGTISDVAGPVSTFMEEDFVRHHTEATIGGDKKGAQLSHKAIRSTGAPPAHVQPGHCLSFAQHAPLGSHHIARYLHHSLSFTSAISRLVNDGYQVFCTGLGRTLNGVPVYGETTNRFERNTVLKKGLGAIDSEQSIKKRAIAAAAADFRLDGVVATRVWKIVKEFDTVGALVNIPGQMGTTDWTPSINTLRSDVASITMYTIPSRSPEFVKIGEVFTSSSNLPDLRANLEALGYQLTLAFPQ